MIGFTHSRTVNKGAKKFICSNVLKEEKKKGGEVIKYNYHTVETGGTDSKGEI